MISKCLPLAASDSVTEPIALQEVMRKCHRIDGGGSWRWFKTNNACCVTTLQHTLTLWGVTTSHKHMKQDRTLQQGTVWQARSLVLWNQEWDWEGLCSGSEAKNKFFVSDTLLYSHLSGEMVCILTHESALPSEFYFFFPFLLALGLGVRSGV